MNLANFLGEGHSELLGWSPSETKPAKVILLTKSTYQITFESLSKIRLFHEHLV